MINTNNKIKDIVEAFNMIIISILIAFLINQVIAITVIHGGSMEPNFYEGEKYIVNKVAYITTLPNRNDIIVFKPEGFDKFLIKRVVATEGDTVETRGSKVYVNNIPLEEDYIKEEMHEDNIDKIKLSKGEVYVLGDNRNHSLDSRNLGPIKKESILGRIVGPPKR